MNGNLGYAWLVPVPNDDLVETAVVSGKWLRKTKRSGVTGALIPVNSVSEKLVSKLDSVFDVIIIKDTKALMKSLNNNDNAAIDSLFLAVLNMTAFSRVVIIRPGIMVQQQCESLFACVENLVMMDKKSEMDWNVAVVSPNLKKFNLAINKLEGNGVCMQELQLVKLAFSDHWKYFTDHRIKDDDTERLPQNEPLLDTDTSDWIAIVGMACRFPQANSPEEYWNILASGENACTTPPSHRLKLVDLDTSIKANFLKCPIDQFDANFFGFSPSEANFTDPQARLLLEVSWEAWEDASINPDSLKGSRTGVFYGSWLQEYRDAMNANGPTPDEDFIRKYLGNSFGCSAAKLSFFYGFTGPNISTESGCSSSMVAVDLAMKSLQNRECPVAMVAGSNVLLHMGVKQKVLWAEDGKSKTFDEEANGYARAEGIAVIILKRYSDAKRDGDRVHAVIRGSAVSQEGLSKSFGTPTVDSECNAMTEALRRANVSPWEVDYVEAHATGTAVGDPIEAQAIVKAYGPKTNNEKRRLTPLWIGSGKTNVGHTESCSGLAGIFKVVLALKHQLIPRHLNLNKMNPQVNFDQIPGRIPSKTGIDWLKSQDRLRIAGVSSFGITGSDVHVILQEAPEQVTMQRDVDQTNTSHPIQILTLSAKTEGALEQLSELYKKHLETSTDTLEDICYTANSCRPHHQFRRTVVGETKNGLVNSIAGKWNKASTGPPKICFTFPGRIGQMDLEPARILYRTAPVFRQTMDSCETLFKATTGKSMLSLLENREEELCPSKGLAWYALIPAVQYSLVKLWGSWGIHPNLVMGHCIGEISAAVVSGALYLEDVFKLIQCMEYFLESGKEQSAFMMAIQANSETVEGFISKVMENKRGTSSWIEVASRNAFDQIVVAGDSESIGILKEFLHSRGYRCKILQMDFCAHSRAVEEACQKSLPTFEKIRHYPKKIQYISSVTGAIVEDNQLNGRYWYQVFRESVNFTGACKAASLSTVADAYIEIGLEGALTKLTQNNLARMDTDGGKRPSALCSPSLWKVEGDKCWMGLLSTLGKMYGLGANVDWNGFYGGQKQRRRVLLPGYPFQRKSFWYEKREQRKEENCLAAEKYLGMRKIHGLLGGIIETCVGTPKVFQNWMRVCESETGYICDHIIGSKVIFPAAGFLEMILAAVEHTEGEMEKGNALVVDGFSVCSPLCLEANSTKIVQTVVDTNGKSVSVHASLNDTAYPWTLHASGTWTFGMKTEMEVVEKWGDIQRRCCVEKERAAEEFYKAAGEVGLNFGERFRSIKKVFCGRDDDKETLIEVDAPTNGQEGFIIHPVLIDAMIQGLILHSKPELKKLHVPVKIGRFMLATGCRNGSLGKQGWFVHCKTNENSGMTRDVHLLNNEGIVVATMSNTELVMTSVESVLKAAGCYAAKEEGKTTDDKNNVALDKFDVVWKRSDFHQMANSISLKEINRDEMDTLLSNLINTLSKSNAFSREELELDENMNKLCDMYVIKALYEFGWLHGSGMEDVLNVGCAEKWGVVPELIPAYKHFVSFLGDKLPLQTPDSIDTEINKVIEKLKDYPAMETIKACGSQLNGILRGNVNPHVILFGTNTDNDCNLAEHYYRNCRFGKIAESLEEVFKVISWEIQKNGTTGTIRILEVGAGTGGFAAGVVRIFGEEKGVKYEYTFTDLSRSFLGKARERFQNDPVIFKLLNVEVDPLMQGFSPEYFDIVVAMNVVHATKDVLRSLKNLEILTKPGGWFLLGETEKPIREVDICFGILNGYWLYEDGLRKDHCVLDGDKWLELMCEAGFRGCHGKFLSCESQMSVMTGQKLQEIKIRQNSGYNGNWVVFYSGNQENWLAIDTLGREMSDKRRRVTPVELKEGTDEEDVTKWLHDNQDDLEGILFWIVEENTTKPVPPHSRKILKPLLQTARYLLHAKVKSFPRFHLVTEDFLLSVQSAEEHSKLVKKDNENVDSSLAWGFMRNLRIELPGILSKSVDLESRSEVTEKISQLMHELWLDDKETEVAYRTGGVRHVRRAFQRKSGDEEVGTTAKDSMHGIRGKYFAVELPKSKVIQDVRFVEMEKKEPQKLGDKEVLVQVKSVSLNFKDVLAVMKPSDDFEHLTSIGLDFSGVVTGIGSQVTKWKSGQAVFGVGWEEGAMRSHLVTNEAALISMPDCMTFNEAATLPAVFLTAWYCMVEVAKLRDGQTMLLHAASGGVGLAAVQIAKILGVRVIGTAGSEKKRRFLRKFGIEHVLNSRTLDFKTEITKITEGRGVDMVLNCLTGPGFKEASLEVCRDGGNFVEISKLDIWMSEEVKNRKPGVNYTIVDLTKVDDATLKRMMGVLDDFLGDGKMHPLPYTKYPASTGLKEALTYLQKAKQIGKVIVTMPEFQIDNGGYRDVLFNDRSTYLVTGGKGAIGFKVAKWMVERQGARYLVLVGRSPASDAVTQCIHELERKHGAVIKCVEADIGIFEECKRILEEIGGDMPPLRGIHHLAAILSDKLLSFHDDWNTYDRVIKPKIQGAWNLHTLTERSKVKLEFFVLHSSAATTFGNIGQSNYVAANCYLDALAELREFNGLPCLSVNWGQWNMGFAKDLRLDWLHPFSAEEGLATLEELMSMRYDKATIVAGLFDFYGLLNMTPYYKDTFLRTLNLDKASFFGRNRESSINELHELRSYKKLQKKVALRDQYLVLTEDHDRRLLVKEFVIRILCETLGTKPEEIQDENQHFTEMGMDSLMSIEFVNKINAELVGGVGGGASGGFLDLEEYGTVVKMAELVGQTLTKL